MEAAVESPRAEGKRKRRRTTAASTDAKIPASSPRVGSPRAAEKAEADAAKAAVADDIDCSCPVCMDPVACAAKAQCGHALCWTCAHQICRVADDDHPAHCPMCRAVIREHEDEAGRNGTLGRCAAMDAAADRLAAETMDTTALAMWKEKREEGEAIVSRIEEDRDVGRAYRVTAGDGYASLEIHLAASIAPSGRAVCKVCSEAIEARAIRIAARTGGGFCHMECKDLDMIKQAKAARRSVRGAKGSGEVRLTIQTNFDERSQIIFERSEERIHFATAREEFHQQSRAAGGSPGQVEEDLEQGDSNFAATPSFVELFADLQGGAAAASLKNYGGSDAQAADQRLLNEESALKRRLQQASADMPWWCIAKHDGNIWDEVNEADFDFPEDDLDVASRAHMSAYTMAHAILREAGESEISVERLEEGRMLYTLAIDGFSSSIGPNHEGVLTAQYELALLLNLGAGRTVAAAAAANQLHIATGRHLPGQSSLAAAAPLSGAHITIPPLASAAEGAAGGEAAALSPEREPRGAAASAGELRPAGAAGSTWGNTSAASSAAAERAAPAAGSASAIPFQSHATGQGQHGSAAMVPAAPAAQGGWRQEASLEASLSRAQWLEEERQEVMSQLRIQGAAIARPLPSADHGPPVTDPSTAQITALNALGRSEARRLLEAIIPRFLAFEEYGPLHEITLNAQHTLANLLVNDDDVAVRRDTIDDELAEARRLYEIVIAGRATSPDYGPKHTETLDAQMDLAILLTNRLGQVDTARGIFEMVVTEFAAQLGPQHSRTLDAMCWHAFVLDEQGGAVGARQLFEKVVEGRTGQIGALHMDTLTAQCNLAILRKRLGETEAAKQLFRETYRGFVAAAGKDHEATLNCQCELIELYIEEGDLAEAKELPRVAEALSRQLGLKNTVSAYARGALGLLRQRQGRAEEAEAIYAEVLETQIACTRTDHPDALKTQRRLQALRQGRCHAELPRLRARNRVEGAPVATYPALPPHPPQQ